MTRRESDALRLRRYEWSIVKILNQFIDSDHFPEFESLTYELRSHAAVCYNEGFENGGDEMRAKIEVGK